MEKCDVCGKITILPEKIGTSNICKVCFMKTNGPLWKYRKYEKYADTERQREKTIESAVRQGYPENVIKEINKFFDSQQVGMMTCDACGQTVQTLNTVGESILCKKCFSKINNGQWKREEYENREEIEKARESILTIATKQRFPSKVVSGINVLPQLCASKR